MENVLLAVYGTLKKGQGNHRYLEGAEFVGPHVTEPDYTMYSLGGFPCVTLKGETPITTEIYKVTDEKMLASINRLEGFTGVKDNDRNWYDTKTIETPYGSAELYYFKEKPHSNTIITNGIWK